MPQESWHSQKATHDYETYDLLRTRKDQYCDWESVTLFYAALHQVDGYLAKRNIHPENHGERNKYVRTMLGQIRTPYLMLYQYARKARYISDVTPMDRD